MTKVFIDGSSGTTGLRIEQRLGERKDVELIKISEEYRKDESARRDALNESDISFLCLPDEAARQSASLIENPNTAVIDTSTAHRTDPGWVYGFPEINGLRDSIASGKRIANPGCHASGFIALVAPLVQAGVIRKREALSCTSLTGYSGGGKKMIAEYESDGRSTLLDAPRMYGLSQAHKHLPEMVAVCGISGAPAFCPIVAPFYSGMEVIVPMLGKSKALIEEIYAGYYQKGLVRFVKDDAEAGFMSAAAMSGRDDMVITVHGNDERLVLVSRFDNLGKGASGAALQNMNLVLGLNESYGLVI